MKNKIVILLTTLVVIFISFCGGYTVGVDKSNTSCTNKTNNIETTKSLADSGVKNKETSKTEDAKSRIGVSLGGADVHTAGVKKINVYVSNNSSKNIKYIKVNIFEVDKSDGSTIKSDWTNDSSLIKAGASQTIDTYFDFRRSESKLKVELSEVVFE